MTEEAADSGSELERVTMLWPAELKEAVREKHGPRGITDFTIGAVQNRLVDEDRVRELEKEIGQLRYLSQLLADRYAMGGTHQDRESMLMEVGLPSWMNTEGWPEDMKKLVPIQDPKVTKIETPKKEYTDEELAKPAHQVAAETKPLPPLPQSVERAILLAPPAIAPGQAANEVKLGGSAEVVELTEEATDVFEKAGGDLFARIQTKAAEKGIDISGAGLVPASKLPVPERGEEVHNCSYEKRPDGNLYCTDTTCGTWIDESTKPPTLHDSREDPTEPAWELEVQTPVPTEVVVPTPIPEMDFGRPLDEIEVDF